MEPELPAPRFSPENNPQPNQANMGEFVPQNAPELGGFERNEQHAESQSRSAELAPGQPVMAPPVQYNPIQGNSSPAPRPDDTPLVAGDDDLIEKEWVDKAKKILAATRDDPFKREHDVVELQKEYLKKRYGMTLGGSE